MKTQIRTIFVVIIFTLFLMACQNENDKYIQGTWEFNSEHLAEIVSEKHLTVVWFFNGGNFTYQACCFNVNEEVGGRYRIISSSEDRITIELFNTYGTGNRVNSEILIVIDRETGELSIQGTGPFRRLGPY